MPRERIDYQRTKDTRDPTIFYIAAEGEKTEVQYFEQLQGKINDSRVKIEVIKRENPSHSAPVHVMNSMLALKSKAGLRVTDQAWIVIDRDRWGDAQLGLVAEGCASNNISIAFSNPCFEIWLLLHFCPHGNYEDASVRGDKAKLTRKIKNNLGTFRSNKLDINDFFDRTSAAVANAKTLQTSDEPCLKHKGSTVYMLIEKINSSIKFY
jgi:hypothetical protein